MKTINFFWLWGLMLGLAMQVAAQAPNYAWNYAAGSTWIDEPLCVAVDDSGNVYATGRFSDTVDFDPGPGVTSFSVGSGYSGFYLVKVDALGNFKWAHSLNSINGWGYGVCVDDSNNVLVAGKFTGTGDFDFGPGTFTMSAPNPSNMFVMKVDPNGGLKWAKQITGPTSEAPTSIATKADGSMAITGGFGNSVDFDPGPGIFTLNSTNGGAFVLRLDLNGNFLWAGQYRGECKEGEFDAQGNLYLTGLANSGSDIDPGPGVSSLPPTTATYTGVAIKLDPSMNLVWAKPLITSHSVYPEGLAVDAWGNIAIGGSYRGTLDLDPGPAFHQVTSTQNNHHEFLVKLDTQGNFRWGFDQFTAGLYVSLEDVACDASGAFYRMGLFYGTRDFDPGLGTFLMTCASVTGSNMYIAKHDSAGNFVWAATVGGTSGPNTVHSIQIDAQDNVIWGGKMYYPADMDPGSGTVTVTGSYQGDIAVSKWGICPAIATSIAQTDCDTVTVNGQTYTQSGTYTQTLQAVSGCDSIVTIQVTISRTDSTIYASSCDSYTLNNQTYGSSGVYTQVLTNVQGCDSILTLNFTLLPPSSFTIADTACNSYTYNNQTYTSSGTYTQQFTNTLGCDSTVILHLVIHPTDTGLVQATICDVFTLNGGTYTSPGTYFQTHTSTQGCDSVLMLVLSPGSISAMVQQSGNSLTALPSGASYQWLDCGNSLAPLPGATGQTLPLTASGSFAVVVTDGFCSDTSGCFLATGLSPGFAPNILAVPNPNNGKFLLDLRGVSGDGLKLAVYDAFGQLVRETSLEGDAQNLIDLGDVAQGCYWGVLRQGSLQTAFRVMVE